MPKQSPQVNEPTNLELLFLGTGNAFSMAGRYWGAILVNNRILFDCSPVVVPHMKKLERNLSELEYIFITHFHADHFFGLPFLLLDYAYLASPKHALNIIGPSNIENIITRATDLGFPGVAEKLKDKLKVNYFEIEAPGIFTVSDLKFDAIPMEHGTISAFGYKIELQGKVIGYTGDTDLCEGVYDLAEKTDILIVELSNPYDDVPGHMSMGKVQKLQERLSSKTKLILNHVGPITEPLPANPNLLMPNDLDVLRL